MGIYRYGEKMHIIYAASRSARVVFTLATWMDFANPSTFNNLICSQEGSNSYQARPWRAEVGWA